jgi:hypothetical protein
LGPKGTLFEKRPKRRHFCKVPGLVEYMKPLDKFGKFFVENFRDKSLDYLQTMFDGEWKAPELQSLQEKVCKLSPAQQATIRELVEALLTGAMHDVLFVLQEYHDCQQGIEIMVDGRPVAGLSDGLHGEIFGEDGWIFRYSKFPSDAEVERSRWAENEIKRMFGGDGKTTGQ